MSKTDEIDIKTIYMNAHEDPDLFSKIDIDALLDKIEDFDGYSSYLENKTLSSISKDVHNSVSEVYDDTDTIKQTCNKLIGYRYVDRICDLRQGNHIKWIWRQTNIMTRGSQLFTVTMGNNGTILTCKNYGGKFIKINFDEVIIFQKLTMEEQLILMSYEYLDKTKGYEENNLAL